MKNFCDILAPWISALWVDRTSSLSFLSHSSKLAMSSQYLLLFISTDFQDELERDKRFPSGQCWEREHPYWGQGGMRARQMPVVSEREQMYISQHRQRRGGQVADCSLLRDMAGLAQLLTTSWFDSGSLNSCISSCTTLWDQHRGGVCVCVRAQAKVPKWHFIWVSSCFAVFGFTC